MSAFPNYTGGIHAEKCGTGPKQSARLVKNKSIVMYLLTAPRLCSLLYGMTL